ncbi:hypothetical protein LIER_27680 [Lithospermum erythrorhizon]|uniref:Uncharacterized protein n=1 Tax=Lithospermum erythrorhizon TaxID=34254 RepID=A0AAV3RGT3_LITER
MHMLFSNFVNNLLITINRAPGVEPRASLFAALFSVTHDSFQFYFSTHCRRNMLVKKRPNKVPDKRLLTKWFFARGGMAIGVPRIMTLKSEARPLPPDTESDLISVEKIRSVLPQDTDETERLSWYTYVDEAMLIKAGLEYNKSGSLCG